MDAVRQTERVIKLCFVHFIIAVCVVWVVYRSSKLQIFEVTRKSLCVVTCHNTICAGFIREALQKAFWFFFSKKNIFFLVTASANQNLMRSGSAFGLAPKNHKKLL